MLEHIADLKPTEPASVSDLLPPETEIQRYAVAQYQNDDPMLDITDAEEEGTPISKQLFTTRVIINDHYEATAMVDSGAGVDCVSRKVVKSVGLSCKKTDPIQATTAIGSASKTTTERVYLKFRVGSRKWKPNFLVLDALQYDMILGQPFVRKVAEDLDFLNGCFRSSALQTDDPLTQDAER